MYFNDTINVANTAGYSFCSIEILGDMPIEPLGTPTCPLGLEPVTAQPMETSVLYG